ncbi:MAG: HAD family phosphatase [Candidatus Omnitrophota bacterium]
MKDIKAILFDLGNVLIKLKFGALEEGYGIYSEEAKKKIEEYILDSKNMNGYMEGKLTSSQFYERTRRLFNMGIGYQEFYRIWNSMFDHYPEVEEIIKALKKKYPKIKLILISNTNMAHWDHIKEEYEILKLLDAIVVSHEIGVQKPDSGIFNEAMRLAGSMPKNTFYTDDRSDLVDAARVMGLRAFQFTGHESLRENLAKCGIQV